MLGFLYLLLNYWRVNSWVSCGTPTKVTGAFPDFCQDVVADASPILSRCPTVVFGVYYKCSIKTKTNSG
jgi:hypothetical protein